MNVSFGIRSVATTARSVVAAGLRRCLGSSRVIGPPRYEVDDTPRWHRAAEQNKTGDCVHELSSLRPVVRGPAAFADPAIAKRFATMAVGSIKPRFVAELPRGRFWGRGYGYVIDAHDALHRDLSSTLDDLARTNTRSSKSHDGFRQPFLPRMQRHPGTVAVISTLFCENFHHWLLDATPKFGLLREAGWDFAKIDAFLLPAIARQPWHREVFAQLGVASKQILAVDGHTHIEASRLLAPSYSEPGREPEKYSYTPEGLAFVRQLFPGTERKREGWPRKIVISRELAAERRWEAGERGHARLAREGFVKICLERHSLDEQAAFFAHARQVVMPTGGGLANLVFAQPGTRVIELFAPSYLPTFSHVLSAAQGLDYIALVGHDPTGMIAHTDAGGRNDIAVPVERVLEALQ